MDRTIYSKYSNEWAERFRIRTDIVVDVAGRKTVYKYAGTKAADPHVRRIEECFRQLQEAYRGSRIRFCPCEVEELQAGSRVSSPFVRGETLQSMIERSFRQGDWSTVETIIRLYGRRLMEAGGDSPFTVTEEFRNVFGPAGQENAYICADVSDVDMIFSNIFVETGNGGTVLDVSADWTVIDYEWTFPFPVPKKFVLYRAIYFAYYQIFKAQGRDLSEWLAMVDITVEEAAQFAEWETHFQEYLLEGGFPVRNMQRIMGTKVIPFEELLAGEQTTDGEVVKESRWIRVRRLLYHIDRLERQDGSVICSGWALAKCLDGRCIPVNIRIYGPDEKQIRADVTRSDRADVAEALKLRRVDRPQFGFDCVWILPAGQKWSIHFSMGNREIIYEG